MAALLKTSRTQVDRLLNPKSDITLSSLQRAAAMVGRRVMIELVWQERFEKQEGRPHSGRPFCQHPDLLLPRRHPEVLGHADSQVLVRIHRHILDTHLVVQMGAGGTAAPPDITNHVTTADALSNRSGEAGKVSVAGADAVAVLQDQ